MTSNNQNNQVASNSKKDIVVKSNRLNSALQNLNLAEIRLIQLGIVDARDSGKGLDPSTPLTINALRYAEVFNTSRQNAYMRIKETEDTLFSRRFSFVDEEGKTVKSRWLSQVRYLNKQGEIEICFTPAVVQGISRIDGAVEFFTKYSLQETAGLDSAYSTRLYELLAQWKTAVKTPLFLLEVLRGQLGLDNNEYQRMFDFKKRILDMAVKEINKKTDLDVKYEQQKEGRVIIGFVFKVRLKKSENPIKDVNRDPNTIDFLTGMTNNEQKKKSSWQIKGLTDAQIKKLAIYQKELIDANTSKMSPNDRRDYPDIFEDWKPMLKDPKQVNTFHKIQELLDRKKT